MLGLQVGAELPIDSDDADKENKTENGKTLLYVFERGYFALPGRRRESGVLHYWTRYLERGLVRLFGIVV